MKKTLKTAMTSAMFAAALGITAGNAPVSAAGTADAPDMLPAEESLMDRTAETMVCVYGPPEYFTEPEQTETTALEETVRLDGVAPMETEPLHPAGIAPIELPGEAALPIYDLNNDNVMSAADLTVIKRAMLNEEVSYSMEIDFNYDGTFDKEDIKELRRMLTGKSKEEEDAEEAAVTTGNTDALTESASTATTTVPDFNIPQPVYGPPEYFEKQ